MRFLYSYLGLQKTRSIPPALVIGKPTQTTDLYLTVTRKGGICTWQLQRVVINIERSRPGIQDSILLRIIYRKYLDVFRGKRKMRQEAINKMNIGIIINKKKRREPPRGERSKH